ncbi:MAG: zinc ribbon domain-containing protein [Armatimonadetes bacterium]|nr:zinc ribbon domain-containing protein [Armatimonadota bacterium]MDE2207978.1 zinc ribbon domain-containing protein [Armatimonadota bacterium]
MVNASEPAEDQRAASQRAERRAARAALISGLHSQLQPHEQLLAFLRGRVAGGWRGKLAIGPEAFFAPYVNIGLTDKRLILQHIHPDTLRPSEIEPHTFELAQISALTYSEIESFGGPPECSLTIRLADGDPVRLRTESADNCGNARAMCGVFAAFTAAERAVSPSIDAHCIHCHKEVTSGARFCPYCGAKQPEPAPSTRIVDVQEVADPDDVAASETSAPIEPSPSGEDSNPGGATEGHPAEQKISELIDSWARRHEASGDPGPRPEGGSE